MLVSTILVLYIFRNREISIGAGAIREQLAHLDLRIIIENSLVEWKQLGEEGPTGNEWEDRKINYNILLQEGFIENVRKHRENNILTLRHRRNKKESYKMLLNLKRISRPGLRIYSNFQRIPQILGVIGIVILSTSQGIMTDREAQLKTIGGEILCYIW
ncbi:hypothetical protein N665_1045s0003 [Sinapis alba]|nr:hypothetical protein N665_1045s0003 [Sinapis alba]